MALKDKWKNTGKNIGGAFTSFGKAIGKTAKVAFSKDENKVDENGESELKKAWKDTGKGFKESGKSFGTAAAGTVDKVLDKEEKEEKPKEEVVEAEFEKVDEEKKEN